MEQYGQHSMFDVKLGEAGIFSKPAALEFIEKLLTATEMNPIGPLHYDLYTGDLDWDGPSFTIHIQTSHITAHYFEKGFLFLDIFSCKAFKVAEVLSVLNDTFDIKEIAIHHVTRGRAFPW